MSFLYLSLLPVYSSIHHLFTYPSSTDLSSIGLSIICLSVGLSIYLEPIYPLTLHLSVICLVCLSLSFVTSLCIQASMVCTCQ